MVGYILEGTQDREELYLPSFLGVEGIELRYGSIRLLRAKSCKNKLFYAPVIPSSLVLLLFPEGVHPEHISIRENGYDAAMEFLRLMMQLGVSFRVVEALGCVSTGSLFFLLDCLDAENALEVLETAEKCSRDETQFIWPCSSLYVHAMECAAIDNEQQAAIISRKDVFLPSWKQYYHYPACLVCAERLDKTLTGYKQLGTMCRCGKRSAQYAKQSPDGGSRGSSGIPPGTNNSSGCGSRYICSCMLKSSCGICKLLLGTLKEQQGEKMCTKAPLVSSPSSTSKQIANNDHSSLIGTSSPVSNVPRCATCGRTEDPWVCLICGYIGCSRYQAMHAKEHYAATGHYFSINLLTQEVWDYESDRFVHRLVVGMDRDTGSTSRIQYPEREIPSGVACGGLRALNDNSDGEEGDGVVLGETVAKKKGMLFEKKCLSTKFDAHNSSHTQHSIMLKNDLDKSRNLLEATVVLDMASYEALDCFYSSKDEEDGFPWKEEMPSGLSSILTEKKGDSYFYKRTVERVLPLPDLERPVRLIGEALKAHQRACTEIEVIDADIQALEEEEKELQKLYEEQRLILRQMMTQNISEIKALDEELEEQKAVRQEIKANISTAAALRDRGSNPDERWSAFAALSPGTSDSSAKKKGNKRK